MSNETVKSMTNSTMEEPIVEPIPNEAAGSSEPPKKKTVKEILITTPWELIISFLALVSALIAGILYCGIARFGLAGFAIILAKISICAIMSIVGLLGVGKLEDARVKYGWDKTIAGKYMTFDSGVILLATFLIGYFLFAP